MSVQIHPIDYDNFTVLDPVIDDMEELGLWLMYEMRQCEQLAFRRSFEFLRKLCRDYGNSSAVKEQVTRLRNRTNLLLYYTADEPDGSEDPVSTLVSTTAYINTLDPYRPSSLILNCQDYFFTNYSEGAPILMQDTYPIGINATYSTVYNTSCTREVGDCGCDNCRGGYEDIRDRMDDFTMRLEVLGRERSKTVWTVPQAFGSSSCVQTRYIRPPL